MSKTRSNTPRVDTCPPLNIPLGQVYVTKEAVGALLESATTLDDVLEWHATGYGEDGDPDDCWDNYDCAAAGGPNCSVHDLDEEEVAQLWIVTPPDRAVTIVSLHTEAE